MDDKVKVEKVQTPSPTNCDDNTKQRQDCYNKDQSDLDRSDKTGEKSKSEYFTGASRRRISKMVQCGIPFVEARARERERYSAWKATQETKGIHSTIPQVTGGSRQKMTVAIMHANYPHDRLSEEELNRIRKSIISEIDSIPDNGPVLQFATTTKKEGWLSMECNNQDTVNWLLEIGNSRPWYEDTKIVLGDQMPKTYTCVAYVRPEDAMLEEQFLGRLCKQNLGINTVSWSIKKVETERNGGQTYTFSVDEASKKCIENNKYKLFLSLAQIDVKITDDKNSRTSVEEERGAQKPCSYSLKKPHDRSSTGQSASLSHGRNERFVSEYKPTNSKRSRNDRIQTESRPSRSQDWNANNREFNSLGRRS